MNDDPIIAPSVVAEPVPREPIPALPDRVWLLVCMRKSFTGQWKPCSSEHESPEGAKEHWKHLLGYHAKDIGPDAYIVKVELRPKANDNTKWAVGVISEAVAEFQTLRDKLAEVEAANAELRARLDAIKLHPCE